VTKYLEVYFQNIRLPLAGKGAGLVGAPAGQLRGKSASKGREHFTGTNGNLALVDMKKMFSENYSQFGHTLSKFRQSCPKPKNLKEYLLEGALNYWSVRGDNVGPGSTE
jgi:hypothetical protein